MKWPLDLATWKSSFGVEKEKLKVYWEWVERVVREKSIQVMFRLILNYIVSMPVLDVDRIVWRSKCLNMQITFDLVVLSFSYFCVLYQ